MIFRCESCESATFEHPDTTECDSVEGACALLVRAGWKSVWVTLELWQPGSSGKHILSRGGWICHECVRRFT